MRAGSEHQLSAFVSAHTHAHTNTHTHMHTQTHTIMHIQDLDSITAARDDAMRAGSEHQLSAFVHANTKKEKVGLERMMVIESSIRDIATATAGAMAQLQVLLVAVLFWCQPYF